MRRRQLSIFLNVLLIVLGVLLVPPEAFRLLQHRTLPLFLAALVLTIGARLWLEVLERPPSSKRLWDSSRPPYPGLESFMVQDAAVFFGREKQIAELLDRIHPTVPERAHRFVVVIGPSGAGKSSLVQAGLLPRLGQRRRHWVALPTLVSGNQPTRSLARSLASALPNISVDALAAELTTGPQGLIRRVEELCAASGRHAASALIVIDQAEELLTRAGEQERTAFFRLLEGALTDDPRLWVIATLRSEFLIGLLTTGFAHLFRIPVVIGSLSRAALFEVIEAPAAQVDLTFAPGLVNQLVDDTGGGDAALARLHAPGTLLAGRAGGNGHRQGLPPDRRRYRCADQAGG